MKKKKGSPGEKIQEVKKTREGKGNQQGISVHET